MTRDPDQDALGLVLPATAPRTGSPAATAKGQMIMGPPGGCYRAEMRFGALAAPEARAFEAAITWLRGA